MLAASTMALAPKTVILVRHGAVNREAAGLTPDGLYGGDVDVPLSERGEAEARAAAQFVADTFGSKVTSVFASPMKRAMYGAERTVEALQREMKVEAREAFREVRRGDWVDKSIEQVSKEYPGEDMQRFLDDYDFNPAGGGESVNEVQARAKKCLLEDVLPSIQEGECAVVVSHLFITRSLLSFAEPSTPVAEISVPTASVSTLEFTGMTSPSTCGASSRSSARRTTRASRRGRRRLRFNNGTRARLGRVGLGGETAPSTRRRWRGGWCPGRVLLQQSDARHDGPR